MITNDLFSVKEAKDNTDNIIFAITKEDLQCEARQRIGRELTDEEIDIAKDGLDWGLQTCTLDIIYNTIFTEMI